MPVRYRTLKTAYSSTNAMIVVKVRCVRKNAISDLLRHELAQQAARSNKQYGNKDDERDTITQVGVDRCRKRLRDAHDIGTEHSAGDVTDATQDRCDERFHTRPYSQERGRQHTVSRAVQDAAGAGQRRAHDERRADDNVDVDAHEAGGRLVERYCAHLLTHERLVDKPEQQDHQEERNTDVE